MEGKKLSAAARRLRLAGMLAAALTVAAAGRTEAAANPPDPERSSVLVSGLTRPLPDGPAGAEAMRRTEVLLPDEFLVVPGEAAGLASRIIAAEGGPMPNPASSAAGYGQFLRGTWLEMFARTYPQVAQKLSSDQILALRDVKPLALELTSRYALENAVSLRRLGLPADQASLSLAHAVGPGGAINVLISRPDEPVQNLLSPAAMTANPFLKEMTAGGLRHWANSRIGPPSGTAPPKASEARVEDAFEPLKPTEDFRVDGQTMASEILAQNRDAIAGLENFLEAASKIGAGSTTGLNRPAVAWLNSVGVEPAELFRADPTAVRDLNRNAARLVLGTVRTLVRRPAYDGFKRIEGTIGHGGDPKPPVIRDVASALLGKMRRESETVMAIVRHRRGAGAERPMASRNAAREGT